MTRTDRIAQRLEDNAWKVAYVMRQIERMGFVSVAAKRVLTKLAEERAELEAAA